MLLNQPLIGHIGYRFYRLNNREAKKEINKNSNVLRLYVEQQGSGQWQHYTNTDFCVGAGANPGRSLLSGSSGTR
jgi:hypothetical protein